MKAHYIKKKRANCVFAFKNLEKLLEYVLLCFFNAFSIFSFFKIATKKTKTKAKDEEVLLEKFKKRSFFYFKYL